jgi:sec-independent protein translocase protein TatB
MDFMAVGTSEVLMILLVALLVVGPNKVVQTARTLGRIMRSIRKASYDLTSAVTRELEMEEREKGSKATPQERK